MCRIIFFPSPVFKLRAATNRVVDRLYLEQKKSTINGLVLNVDWSEVLNVSKAEIVPQI